MIVRFPGQRRPPGESPTHLAGVGYADLAVLPSLTLVGDRDRGRGRHALRVLDGCAPFGSGCDELVSLLADACAPVDPLELRGEGEALAAFRAANGRGRERLPVPGAGRRVAARRASRRPRQPAAEWSGTRSSGAAPLLGSALAVAASAVVMVFAYTGTLAVAQRDGGRAPAAVRPAFADRQETVEGATGGGSVVAEPGRTSSSPSTRNSSGAGPTGRRAPASSSGVDSASVPTAPGQFAAGRSPSAAGPWLPAPSQDVPSESPTGSPVGAGPGVTSGPSAEDGSGAGPGMAHGEHGESPADLNPGKGPRAGQKSGQNPGQNSGRSPGRGPNTGKVLGKGDMAGGALVSPVPKPAPRAGVAPTAAPNAAPSAPIAGSSLDAGVTAPMAGIVGSESEADRQSSPS